MLHLVTCEQNPWRRVNSDNQMKDIEDIDSEIDSLSIGIVQLPISCLSCHVWSCLRHALRAEPALQILSLCMLIYVGMSALAGKQLSAGLWRRESLISYAVKICRKQNGGER
jgi:hypothetical protein